MVDIPLQALNPMDNHWTNYSLTSLRLEVFISQCSPPEDRYAKACHAKQVVVTAAHKHQHTPSHRQRQLDSPWPLKQTHRGYSDYPMNYFSRYSMTCIQAMSAPLLKQIGPATSSSPSIISTVAPKNPTALAHLEDSGDCSAALSNVIP